MAKYKWEAKPPLTRTDVFGDGWEEGSIFASSDEEAIQWAERMIRRHGKDQTIRVLSGNRTIRVLGR